MTSQTGTRGLKGAFLIAVLSAIAAPAWAQEGAPEAARAVGPPAELDGAHLYSVSGSFQYSSIPLTLLTTANPAAFGPEASGLFGVGVGFTHRVGRSLGRFSIRYDPSYSRYFTYSGLNSFNQRLGLDFTTKIGKHWSLTAAGTGEDATLDQYLFGSIASAGAGETPPPGAVAATAGQAALYGVKRLTVTGDVNLGYHPSARWAVVARTYANESDSRVDQQQSAAALIPHIFTGGAVVTANFSATPETTIGATADTIKSRSALADYQISTFRGTVRRKFARKWYAELAAGGGYASVAANLANVKPGASYVYSGGFGYKGREDNFSATYARMMGDSYGYGSATTSTATAMWNWFARSRQWSLSALGSRQQLAGSALGQLTAWEASIGVSKPLGRQATVTCSYVNLTESAPLVRVGDFSVHEVRLGVVWIPFLREVARLNRQIATN